MNTRRFFRTLMAATFGTMLSMSLALTAQAAGGGGDHAGVVPLGEDGDISAGEAKSAPCTACHGTDGNSIAPIYPTIAGQSYRYLLRQLTMIKDGTRAAPLMAGQLNAMSEEDLQNLALYYSKQTANVGQSAEDALELGENIYRAGLIEKQVTACTACHSPRGNGNPGAGFPSLRGQPVDYLVEQLTKYREGQRETDEEYGGMMRQVAGGLTDGEIKAVANYVHGLH